MKLYQRTVIVRRGEYLESAGSQRWTKNKDDAAVFYTRDDAERVLERVAPDARTEGVLRAW